MWTITTYTPSPLNSYYCSLVHVDPTLTAENVSTALATIVDTEKLGKALLVPPSKIGDIQLQRSTAAQKRKALIDYFIKYSEFASWTELANSLYQRGHPEAMITAKTFIKQTPGRYTV